MEITELHHNDTTLTTHCSSFSAACFLRDSLVRVCIVTRLHLLPLFTERAASSKRVRARCLDAKP